MSLLCSGIPTDFDNLGFATRSAVATAAARNVGLLWVRQALYPVLFCDPHSNPSLVSLRHLGEPREGPRRAASAKGCFRPTQDCPAQTRRTAPPTAAGGRSRTRSVHSWCRQLRLLTRVSYDRMGVARMTPEISLLIIAHNPLLRDGIAGLLNEQSDMSARAVGPEWEAAQSAVVEVKPQLILLDSCLGASFCRQLREVTKEFRPTPRVVVMDLLGGPEEVVEFVESGCSGLILKNTTTEHFLATIRSVSRGDFVLSPSLTETIFSYVARRAATSGADTARAAVTLTQREHEVMGLIVEGLSNKAMAEKLHIAVHTVQSHVHVILEKLALRTRHEIAAFAIRQPGQSPTSPFGRRP
jgi:DNA-binding NarL/FixJ family response regulator